jgi:branched-subunit amino acid transport protein
MMVRPAIVLLIICATLVTVVPRVLPIMVLSRIALPVRALRWLSYVPAAVLAALLAQAVLLPNGRIEIGWQNLSLLALVPTLIVAQFTRSLGGTVLTGIVVMALLRLILP